MTSISPPSSLATFTSSQASSSRHPHVRLSPVNGRDNGWAVAAAQGDGVWTYQLATLRPLTTFTVPPSTSFNTSPISFYPPSRHSAKAEGKQKADESQNADDDESSAQRVTLVGVQRGEGVKKEQEGKVLWAWKGEEGVKSVVTLDHAIRSIHHILHHRAPVLCVHTDGHLTALDSALHTRPVVLATAVAGPIIAANVTSVTGEIVRVVLLSKSGLVSVVEMDIGGGREIAAKVVKSGFVGKSSGVELGLASVAEDGLAVAAASNSNTLYSRHVRELGQSVSGTNLSRALTAAPLPLPLPGRPIALLAVAEPGPSILLVSPSAEAPAVLQSFPLSSIISAPATITHLANVATTAPGIFTIALTVTQTEGGRTTVYTTEVVVPEKGVGMNLLLGTQRLTSEYFGLAKAAKPSAFDHIIADMVKTVPDGSALAAVEGWLQVAEKSSPAGTTYHLPESHAKALLGAVFDLALKKTGDGVEKTGVYASDIVQLLLRKKWVNHEMYPGGVVHALIQLEDWASTSLAIRSISTIPSTSIIAFIKRVCQSDDGMETPSLDSVLLDVLSSPVPPPDFRAAQRSHLPVEDATKVLETYTRWMSTFVNTQGHALSGWADEKPKQRKKDTPKGMPSLDAIIAYASSLLDSHLPLFLAYPPSFDLLQSLQDSLTPLLAMQDSYRRLRAPVEAVLTLSRREARKQAEREAKRNARAPAGVVAAAAAAAAGKGKNKNANANQREDGMQMPDEAVGKWRVEQFVF